MKVDLRLILLGVNRKELILCGLVIALSLGLVRPDCPKRATFSPAFSDRNSVEIAAIQALGFDCRYFVALVCPLEYSDVLGEILFDIRKG